TNGRIYKITYGEPSGVSRRVMWQGDLSKLGDAELVKLQTHKNEWQVRHSRRLLQERAAIKKVDAAVIADVHKRMSEEQNTVLALRYLWLLNAIDPQRTEIISATMAHRDEIVRGWAIRLAVDDGKPSHEDMQRLEALASAA